MFDINFCNEKFSSEPDEGENVYGLVSRAVLPGDPAC
jgi:hypothetical protein